MGAAIDFSRAVDAPIVTSMPTGVGTRGADGEWQLDQARRSLTFTKANGGTIAAVEYMNEPTLASMGGAPKGYDAAAYGRDFRGIRRIHADGVSGDQDFLAPGSVGEANADWAVATGGYGDLAVLPQRILPLRRATPTLSPTTTTVLLRSAVRPWGTKLARTKRYPRTGSAVQT